MVATYAAMKSGLKGKHLFVNMLVQRVATYAAMKSGLKDTHSPHCRDVCDR